MKDNLKHSLKEKCKFSSVKAAEKYRTTFVLNGFLWQCNDMSLFEYAPRHIFQEISFHAIDMQGPLYTSEESVYFNISSYESLYTHNSIQPRDWFFC
jgi:hypothetical protein